MKYSYNTKGTCSSRIDFELDGNIVKNVQFIGGCNGNTQGLTVDEVEKRLKGIQCGMRGTSCVDQLATAVQEALEKGEPVEE